MYRWYLPFSAGNLAPGSLEIQSRNELTCLLNSPLLSAGSTQSVTLPVVDCALNVNDYSSHISFWGYTLWGSAVHSPFSSASGRWDCGERAVVTGVSEDAVYTQRSFCLSGTQN